MNRLKVARTAVTASVLLGAFLAAGASASSGADGKSQLHFGVDMAKRGLWSEALFRFEQARRLEPQNVSILNNLAICYEADGRFDEALATYREALQLAPENRVLKQNYSRFAEFFQGYRPRKAAAPAAPTASAGAPEGTVTTTGSGGVEGPKTPVERLGSPPPAEPAAPQDPGAPPAPEPATTPPPSQPPSPPPAAFPAAGGGR